jgi:hypothetical protein
MKKNLPLRLVLLAILSASAVSQANEPQVPRPKIQPVPLPKPAAPIPDPTTPAARTVHDARYGVSFHLPAGWNITRRDGDVSTFRLDARSAPRNAQFRSVASIDFNPFPASTFSGALFYSSVTPGLTAASCRFQTTAHPPRTVETVPIDGIPFDHGYDERGNICTESRVETYTTFHNGVCYRFDLVINNFCGGEVSDVKDMTPHEIESIRKRLESILNTVQFDSK